MIRRRSRDIEIRFTIPLPRRWWRRREVTQETRQKLSAAARRRKAMKAGDLRVEGEE